MPRLPDPSAGALPTPNPPGGVAQIPGGTGMEMIPSEQEIAAGQHMQVVGAQMQARADADQRQLAAEARMQARAEAAQAAADARQAKAVAALRAQTDYGNDMADLRQTLTSQVQTGAMKPELAQQAFDTAGQALRDKYVNNVDQEVSQQAQIHMDNILRDSRRQLVASLETNRREQTAADFQGVREGLERRAITDPFGAQGAYEAAARSVLANAGWRPDAIAKDIQAFNEKTTFNYVAGQINAATNNPVALAGLQKTLMDTKQYDALDPDKRRILLNQVEGRQETLRMRAERANDQRLNQLGREMDAISRLSLQGVQPTPDRLAALQAGVKGTPYEAEFKSYLDGLADQRKFAMLPPEQMKTAIDADIASVAKNGGNEADRLRIIRRSQAYQQTVQQITQDPLGYNERTTGQPVPPLDMNNPETVPAVLKERQTILLALNKSHGANVGLFRPEEALQVRQQLRSLPAEKRAAFMSTIYGAVGSGSVYNATLAQIAPDSPVTAFAGQIMGKPSATVSHVFTADTKINAAEVATRMLRGEDLLNPPAGSKAEDGKTRGFQIGKEQDFAQFFNSAAGKAFPGAESQRVRDTYYQAAKAVYADLSLDAGDRSGIVDGSRVKKAFEMVTGGGVVRFGDAAVIPPFGMSADALRSRVYQQFGAAVDAGHASVPATYIKDATLYQVGDGRYLVMNGTKFLPDAKTGQPLMIDVTGTPTTQALPTVRQPKAKR